MSSWITKDVIQESAWHHKAMGALCSINLYMFSAILQLCESTEFQIQEEFRIMFSFILTAYVVNIPFKVIIQELLLTLHLTNH